MVRFFKTLRSTRANLLLRFEAFFIALAITVFFGLTLVNVHAQDPNIPPSAGTPIVFSSASASDPTVIGLGEGTRITGYIEGTASDANGCIDIDTTSQYAFKFYLTTAGGPDGSGCTTTAGSTCYVPSSLDMHLGGCAGTDTTITYSMPFAIDYFAEPTEDISGVTNSNTDWTALVVVHDDANEIGAATDTVDVGLLRALDVSAIIDFGEVSVGTTSASAESVVTNTGNTPIDYNIGYEQDLQCEVNSFPGRSVVITQNGSAASGNAIEMTPVSAPTKVNASIPVATSMEFSSTDSLYSYIVVPSQAGVRGACSNTATYSAATDDNTGI